MNIHPEIPEETLFVVAMLVIAVVICGLKDRHVSRGHRKRYLSMQSGRPALSDDEFCRRAGLDPSVAGIVATVRSKLGECGKCDPVRIYPDDGFYPHFGLAYDDDVAFVVGDMGIIPGFHEYSFPLEEVDSVADFVRVILRLKKEAEPSDGANAALGAPRSSS
jgi:hypothetical protein